MTSFDKAWDMLLQNEGGYSNNPNDPGGATMWGITEKVARAHGYVGNMKDLPAATAREIAKEEYWTPFHCDDFPDKIAFQVLDTAYNGGHPIAWLQQAVGVLADGKVGPITIAAVKAFDANVICMRFIAYRIKYYTQLPTWNAFGKGWANRMGNNLLRASQ